MPIPKNVQNEFFIPKYNEMPFNIDRNDDQAVIYQPYERSHNSFYYLPFVQFHNIFTQRYFGYRNFLRIFSHFNSSHNNDFISNMMRILTNTQNSNNSNIRNDPSIFESYLLDFVTLNNNSDLISLTYDFS